MNTNGPVSIYEVHLNSWMRVPEDKNRPLTREEIAPKLAEYARKMNFTHVELLFLDHSRPEGMEKLVDCLRQNEVGTILESRCKWDTAWADETISYLGNDPLYRKFHHDLVTCRNGHVLAGNFILPLSHELMDHDKRSLIARMNGDVWQKFANLRLLFACMCALPGRKLMFMGCEFGQWNAWNPEASLDWHLVSADNPHGKLQNLVAKLNGLYRSEPALHTDSADAEGSAGFEWIEASNSEMSVIGFLRKTQVPRDYILAVFNFTPVPRQNYRVGVPTAGFWKEILNTDAVEFGGSGHGNLGGVDSAPFGWHSRSCSLTITLPPLGAVFFKHTT